MEVLSSIRSCFLLTIIILNASRFAGTKIGSIDLRVRLKESPEQIIRDFMVLKKGFKAFSYRRVGGFNKAN